MVHRVRLALKVQPAWVVHQAHKAHKGFKAQRVSRESKVPLALQEQARLAPLALRDFRDQLVHRVRLDSSAPQAPPARLAHRVLLDSPAPRALLVLAAPQVQGSRVLPVQRDPQVRQV